MEKNDDWIDDMRDDERASFPKPGKSKILVQLVSGESYLFKNLNVEIGEIQYEGGSAEIEDNASMLEDAIAEILTADGAVKPGWKVIEGFYGHYRKDYFGEVDCDFECDVVRPARWSDIEWCGLYKAPWHVKFASFFGKDLLVSPTVGT